MSTADRPPITSNTTESTITDQSRDMQVPDATMQGSTWQAPIATTSNTALQSDHDATHYNNSNKSYDTTSSLSTPQNTTDLSTPRRPMEDFSTWSTRDEQLLHAVIQHIPFALTAAGDGDQWALVARTCNKELGQLVNTPSASFDSGAEAKERFKILMAAHAALVHNHVHRIDFLPIYEQYGRIRSMMEYCYSLYVKSGNKPDELLRKRKRDQDEEWGIPNEEDGSKGERQGERMNGSVDTLKHQLRELQDHAGRSLKEMEWKQGQHFENMNRQLSDMVELDQRATAICRDNDDQLEEVMKTHSRRMRTMLNKSNDRIRFILDKYSESMRGWSEVQQREQTRWNIMHDGWVKMRKSFLELQVQMFEHHQRLERVRMDTMRQLMKDS